ncbi:MAG: phenylalanine--tRNA ligase subunit alpha [Rickettsiales bacterium]|nr:phenylalanine--tRNA ligase subunit alpha [Rickettsiales bacterium]
MNLDNISQDFNSKLAKITTQNELEEIRVEFLGKKGQVTTLFSTLKDLNPDEKKEFGAKINILRQEVTTKIEEKKEMFADEALNEQLKTETLDVTAPTRPSQKGLIHPISKVMAEIEEIFSNFGFHFASGPEIEDDFHNFTALNIPENHPARQMQDTFYLENSENLLRTHTSNTQIREMLEGQPPFKSCSLGRVFRRDSDQTHTPMFHQFEGFMVDENINMQNLRWILEKFLKEFFEINNVQLRFRPSFFPFTEPSAEVDIGYYKENGQIKIGTPKNPNDQKFMEILGCGMIHENVLKNCNIDAAKYQGFAFGIGVERLAMLKYGINDLRMFFENDIRFLKHYGFDE